MERVYLTMCHHLSVVQETNTKLAEIRDAEFMTSRLTDREMQEGNVIHLRDGYFYVAKTFIYKSVIKLHQILN